MSTELDDPLRGLSPQQVRLLRLVQSGTTSSKALALETALQPGSIDTYLQAAARTLGAKGRIEAAQIFTNCERQNSQTPSQLRSRRLASRLKLLVVEMTGAVRAFVTGLPVGGRSHAFSWSRTVAEVLRAGLLGIAGIAVLLLVVVGLMKTFG